MDGLYSAKKELISKNNEPILNLSNFEAYVLLSQTAEAVIANLWKFLPNTKITSIFGFICIKVKLIK